MPGLPSQKENKGEREMKEKKVQLTYTHLFIHSLGNRRKQEMSTENLKKERDSKKNYIRLYAHSKLDLVM